MKLPIGGYLMVKIILNIVNNNISLQMFYFEKWRQVSNTCRSFITKPPLYTN